MMDRVRLLLRIAIVSGGVALVGSAVLCAQDSNHGRGRKYRPPPETSHIEVLVTKSYNHKPVSNAAVIFHELSADGRDQGNLEVKTDPEGKAVIDVIPIGTNLRVQVLAAGFATFADDFVISETSRQIPIALLRPREQVSAYHENTGAPSGLKYGVQEPVRPKAADAAGSKSVKVPANAAPPKAPPLPPSEQNRTAPVSNPAPASPPNQ